MTLRREPFEDRVPDVDAWDLPDRLTLDECLDETAFPTRRSDVGPGLEGEE